MVDNVFDSKLASRQPFVTQLLSSAVARQRLGHAYLLTGRAQADKWAIARDLACFLNCAHVNGGSPEQACILTMQVQGDSEPDIATFCQNCRWIWEGKHPQAWLTLVSEGTKSGKIAVEKARVLSEELAKESQFIRVVVIENASQDIFHRPAANALLKTIEDPRVNCVFILFAVSVEEVLPTVVSRCQVIPLYTTESIGMTLHSPDLSKFSEPAVKLATDAVSKIMHRKDPQAAARILDFNKELAELLDEDFTPCDAIDLLVAVELQHIAKRAVVDGTLSGYAVKLLELATQTKEQLQHYVSPKAAMETFALSWWKLASDVSTRSAAN